MWSFAAPAAGSPVLGPDSQPVRIKAKLAPTPDRRQYTVVGHGSHLTFRQPVLLGHHCDSEERDFSHIVNVTVT